MKVLCPNKAPKIKRQVASVSKKVKEPSDQDNKNFISGLQHPPKVKYTILTPQHPPKVKYTQTVMVKQPQDERPTLKQFSQGRKCCRDKPVHREADGQLDHQPVKSHLFQVDSREATSLGGRQSVPSCQVSTPSKSEILGFLPKCIYYQPQEDQETYYINSEGHLQCHQDPQNIISAPTVQELPGSKEHPIFHKPGSIKVSSVQDLLRIYPNSFDRLGSLKGEHDIKVDSTVPPVQHVRRKVPIESKAAIKEAIDPMVKQDILEPQIKPTPWVPVTYPVKPTGEVRPCLDVRNLNKAIIWENHKLQTVEEIAHQLAGAVVFMKADALKAYLQVHLTKESSKLLVINTHKGRYRFKRMPFGAKMSQDVFQMKMDLIMERCPGVISIHDISLWTPQCGVYKPNLVRFEHETRCAREFVVSISLWTPQCCVYKPNLTRFEHETRCVREFVVSISLWTPQCGVYKPYLARFEHETRCAREFVVSIGLWTPQTPQTLSHISFHAEIS